MAALSNYLENALIDATIRGVSYTPPSTIYLALFTSDPLDDGSGTEVSGGSYARQSVTFAAPTDGAAVTDADVLFPVATANWGTITHIGIYDASSTGNLLYHGALTNSKTISTDDQLKITAGDITVTLA